MPSFSSRIEARLEPREQGVVRLVLDDVYPDGTQILFTHVDLQLQELLDGTFSRDFAAIVGENLLVRLAALTRQQ